VGGGQTRASAAARSQGRHSAALIFPSLGGEWHQRSNYGRNLWDPACEFVEWPKNADGHGWYWTCHSLRHVFATWALAQLGICIEDISRLMGHSSIRVTKEIYIHVTDDVYDHFCRDRRSGSVSDDIDDPDEWVLPP
jgi:integrase